MIRSLTKSLMLVMLFTATVTAEKPDETATHLRDLKLTSINGQVITPFADSSIKAVSLIFVANTCPVANAYQPSLAAFQKAYADLGVDVFKCIALRWSRPMKSKSTSSILASRCQSCTTLSKNWAD